MVAILAVMSLALVGTQAQTVVASFEQNTLDSYSIQLASDLGIANPALPGDYTQDQINALMTDDAISTLMDGMSNDNITDEDKLLKASYYGQVKGFVNQWNSRPADALLFCLDKAREVLPAVTDLELKALYLDTLTELDGI